MKNEGWIGQLRLNDMKIILFANSMPLSLIHCRQINQCRKFD